MVITLTNLSADIEEVLQRKAAAEGKSVDQAALDLLERGIEFERMPNKLTVNDEMRKVFEEQRERATLKPGTKRDLSFLVGTWVEDPEFDKILEEQRIAKFEDPSKVRDLTGIAGQHLIDDEMRKIFEEQRQIDPELWK